MKRRTFVWIAAVAFALGLLAFLPAKLIEGPINSALAPKFQLSVSGTIWNGAGTLHGTRASVADIPLTWRFAPRSLPRLRAAWQITATGAAFSGVFTVGAGLLTAELRDADVTLDLAAIAGLNPMAEIFRPSGRLQVLIDALVVRYENPMRTDGNARLRINNLGLGTLSERPIGSYYIDADGHDSTTNFILTESFGSVALMGGGTVNVLSPRQFEFLGDARVSTDTPDPIKNWLASIGKPAPDGRLRIEQKISW